MTMARVCTLIGSILLAARLLLVPRLVKAQEWPTRPVKVVVPYGPGGIADVFGAHHRRPAGQVLGQPFIVESRGGASGAIGTE